MIAEAAASVFSKVDRREAFLCKYYVSEKRGIFMVRCAPEGHGSFCTMRHALSSAVGTLTGAAGARKGEPIVDGRFIAGKERPRAGFFGYLSPFGYS